MQFGEAAALFMKPVPDAGRICSQLCG